MTKKVLTVVGARPQFIKAAVVSHAFANSKNMEEALVHTGQHHDFNMSEQFFEELDIPRPLVNLGISGGTHAEMTAKMLVSLEQVLLSEKPNVVLLYGDTNSTLAGALAAAKLRIPLVHVEAGARTRSMGNPEEINRICTDHVASLLLACTEVNLQNLVTENLGERSLFVGDPMYDAFLKYRARALEPKMVLISGEGRVSLPKRFYYLTCHREENTSDPQVMQEILKGMNLLDKPVIYPVHPRNKELLKDFCLKGFCKNVLCIEPVGYLESLFLVTRADQVITDSGGLQREAFFAGVKCTTVLDFEVWPETMISGRNMLANPEASSILNAMDTPQTVDENYKPFGHGDSADKIVEAIENKYK